MIAIYKINHESAAKNVLCISLSDNTKKQISDWQAAMDKLVFDEQIKTGSFRGFPAVSDAWRLRIMETLKKLQKSGNTTPYYGASGGACSYLLQIIPPDCIVTVENVVVGERASFKEVVEILEVDESVIAEKQRTAFMAIPSKEYRTLQKWKNWSEKDEFTSRYILKIG